MVHNFKDLTGQTFTDWTALEYVGNMKWKCRCKCGSEHLVRTTHLYSGASKRCRTCGNKLARLSVVNHNFVARANAVHDNKYDYSLVEYYNQLKHVIIKCPIHGEFLQTPKNHLRGKGCHKCGDIRLSDYFVERAKKIHNNKYDYSKVFFKAGHESITIICPDHGEFTQVACEHVRGAGCKKCAIEGRLLSQEEFIARSAEVHDDKYSYDEVEYINSGLKVIIKCPQHGRFRQRPDQHLYVGSGCPNCTTIISKPHQTILDIIPPSVEVVENDREAIPPYEIDIFIPEYKLGIEIHGEYWHGLRDNNRKAHKRLRKLHSIKATIAHERGITLLQFWGDEVDRKTELIKSMIEHKLGLSDKIYARSCEIKPLTNKDVRQFFNNNHLQGHRNASVTYGLILNGDIVAAASFSRNNKYQWEIIRYACSRHTTVDINE